MEIMFREYTDKIIASLGNVEDLIVKKIKTSTVCCNMLFIDGMLDTQQLDLTVLTPLVEQKETFEYTKEGLGGVISCSAQIGTVDEINQAVISIVEGNAVLLFDKAPQILTLSLYKPNGRNITEPPTSAAIKGPREGFIEDSKSNVLMLRKRLKSPNFTFEKHTVGRYTKTTVNVCYIKGIAKKEVIDEIVEKLGQIDIDGIIDSSEIGKYLENRPYSLFKQVGNSEKPDVIVKKMLDGKVAIIVEGSPIVLTLPYLMLEDFEDVQDNYKRVSRVDFLRFMRICGVFFAVFLPSFFVAVQTFHYQLIPPKLLVTILNAVEGIPFSPTIEMLIALILFEILGEASIRMPRFVGMALSVVGALVLGETAVKAGILSSITVLTVALSGIGIYAVPDEVGTFSILRMLFVIVAGILGVFGILLIVVAVLMYLLGFDEYGVPYLAPIAPLIRQDLLNASFKKDITHQEKRSAYMRLINKTKQSFKKERK